MTIRPFTGPVLASYFGSDLMDAYKSLGIAPGGSMGQEKTSLLGLIQEHAIGHTAYYQRAQMPTKSMLPKLNSFHCMHADKLGAKAPDRAHELVSF